MPRNTNSGRPITGADQVPEGTATLVHRATCRCSRCSRGSRGQFFHPPRARRQESPRPRPGPERSRPTSRNGLRHHGKDTHETLGVYVRVHMYLGCWPQALRNFPPSARGGGTGAASAATTGRSSVASRPRGSRTTPDVTMGGSRRPVATRGHGLGQCCSARNLDGAWWSARWGHGRMAAPEGGKRTKPPACHGDVQLLASMLSLAPHGARSRWPMQTLHGHGGWSAFGARTRLYRLQPCVGAGDWRLAAKPSLPSLSGRSSVL